MLQRAEAVAGVAPDFSFGVFFEQEGEEQRYWQHQGHQLPGEQRSRKQSEENRQQQVGVSAPLADGFGFAQLILARIVAGKDDQHRHHPAKGMGSNHAEGDKVNRQGLQGEEFAPQHTDQPDSPVRADAAVLHDGENLLAGVSSAKTVAKIGKAIFVERAGKQDGGHHAEKDGQRNRKNDIQPEKNSGAHSANNPANEREVARRAVQPFG